MPCFCKCSKTTQIGGIVAIMAGAIALSNGLVDAGQDGNMGRQAAKQDFTLETLLTRDLTYATPGNERYDAAWEKIQSQLGKPAPGFTVGEWQQLNGTPNVSDIKSMRGDIVVIDFWGTWCPPCRAAMPNNSNMADKYAEKDVRVIGICNTRGSEKMMETAEAHDGRFPMAADVDDKTKDAYGVQWWPYYVVVDRDGIVRAAGVKSDKISTVVDRLVAIQPPREKESGEMTSRRRNR